ncbi:hypothetical protein [Acinetobacter gerneri]|jgi:hypothetical protein|uniref:hypothetical protein n=1 Tax=Acinetobacter gerneri TaxID=202952 RepID=UPI0023F003EB|nr:hypothetical protein [Acinetobacter gerneri]MCH4245664.1 hypothetical protein [Acinetobacter gerneri]
MSSLEVKTCIFCREHEEDGAGCIFPYYGLAPHIHERPIFSTEFLNKPLPANFIPDEDGKGETGIYSHCLYCGGDGTAEGVLMRMDVA